MGTKLNQWIHGTANTSSDMPGGSSPWCRRVAPRPGGQGQPGLEAVVCPREHGVPTGEGLTFDPVWLILQRPRPNMDPSSFFAPGTLVIEGQSATFGPSSATLIFPTARPSNVQLALDRIVGVGRKRYGWGLVPPFVAISHEADDGITVSYFNDGGWHGWRPLLTGSDGRMGRGMR